MIPKLDPHVPRAMSNSLNAPAANVPADTTKTRPESNAKLSALATAAGRAALRVMVAVPPGFAANAVTMRSCPRFAAVPPSIRTVRPTIRSVRFHVAEATVIVVAEPPFAVIVLDQRVRHPAAPAPHVPASAPDGACTHESSSWEYR